MYLSSRGACPTDNWKYYLWPINASNLKCQKLTEWPYKYPMTQRSWLSGHHPRPFLFLTIQFSHYSTKDVLLYLTYLPLSCHYLSQPFPLLLVASLPFAPQPIPSCPPFTIQYSGPRHSLTSLPGSSRLPCNAPSFFRVVLQQRNPDPTSSLKIHQ